MKTLNHQREDTGLTRLQSHSSSFEAFSCTIDEFQWFKKRRPDLPSGQGRPGPRQLLSRERPRTSHKRTWGPSSFGREEASEARPRPGGRERAGQRPPGPAGNKAARDSGKNTEQRGRTPGAIAAPFAQDQPALAGRGPTRTTGLGTRAPPGRWEQGACEGETRGAERDAGS